MGWLSRNKTRNLETESASSSPSAIPPHFDSMTVLNGLTSGITADTAMRFTAVFAAMRLRAETIASLPKSVTILTKTGREEAVDHPVFRLLKYFPNQHMNIFSFWEFINACIDGWGNSYVVIRRSSGGVPSELLPVHPSFVTVSLSNGRKWYRIAGSKQCDGLHADDDMLHFFSLSNDGVTGLNPITYNAAAINSGISSTAFGNKFYEKGGSLRGTYETENVIPAADYKVLLERLASLPPNATPILENGLKYKAIGIAPEAAQMLQTRTFALQDIARIFNIPPHMISDLSHATFSNIEHLDIQFVKYSIRPTVKRFETELDRKLLFSDELGKVQTKFNLDGILRGDMKSRAEYYQKGILSGFLSRNEVREMENLNKVDGLDEMLYPSNMILTDEKTSITIEKKQ